MKQKLILIAMIVMGLGSICQADVQRMYILITPMTATQPSAAYTRSVWVRDTTRSGTEVWVNNCSTFYTLARSEYHAYQVIPAPRYGAAAIPMGMPTRWVHGVSDVAPHGSGGGSGHNLLTINPNQFGTNPNALGPQFHPSDDGGGQTINAVPTSGIYIQSTVVHYDGTTTTVTNYVPNPVSVGTISIVLPWVIGAPAQFHFDIHPAPTATPAAAPSVSFIGLGGAARVGTILPTGIWMGYDIGMYWTFIVLIGDET